MRTGDHSTADAERTANSASTVPTRPDGGASSERAAYMGLESSQPPLPVGGWGWGGGGAGGRGACPWHSCRDNLFDICLDFGRSNVEDMSRHLPGNLGMRRNVTSCRDICQDILNHERKPPPWG